MPVGTVKWFNSTKGYGFIQPDSGGPDVFVHISAVERAGMGNLAEGQKISFEEQRDPKRGKTSAENLKAVYEKLGSRLTVEKKETEVSGLLALVAAVLALLAGGLSMLWFNRVL